MTIADKRRRALAIAAVAASLAGAAPVPAMAQVAGADPQRPESWRTPEFMAQWGLYWSNAEFAYALGLDGSGVTIGLVDGGIDLSHPEFAGRDIRGGWSPDGSNWSDDPEGHGTLVASVIIANRDGKGMHGVAPGATLLMARITDREGSREWEYPSGAIDWLVSQSTPYILLEFGYLDIGVSDVTPEEYQFYHGDILDAVRRGSAAGSIFIVPTHNGYLPDANVESGLPHLFPELEQNWIAVTALGKDGKPDYANACGVAKNWCMAAPGGGDWYGSAPYPDDPILAAAVGGGYELVNGTSFAGPHVAGAAALTAQMFPYMSSGQIRQVLLGTAWDMGASGVDDVYGYGALNIGKAIGGPAKFDWGDFNVVQPDGYSIWRNDIEGAGGLTRSGSGVLVLTGNSTYQGDTRIGEGVLVVQGSIASDTYVDTMGWLSGSGSIHGNVENRGLVYGGFGQDGGTLTINGDYTQADQSTLRVMIGASSGTNRIDVSGSAEISGTVQTAMALGGFKGDERHTILTAGNLSGAFTGITGDYAFLDLSLGYGAASAYLDVRRNSIAFADIGETPNQRAAGAGAESVPAIPAATPTLFDHLIGLNADNARIAFESLSGEIHASTKTALITESSHIRNAATARLRGAFGNVGAPSFPVLSYGPDGSQVENSGFIDGLAVWGNVFASQGNNDGNGNAAPMTHSVGGVLVGGDAPIGDWRAGLLAGYSHSSFRTERRGSSADSANYHLGLYAGRQWGNLAFRSGIANSWHQIDTSRIVAFGDFSDRLAAGYDATSLQLFAETGYRVDAGDLSFEPYANIAHLALHSDGFAENGGSAALAGESGSTSVTFSTLGLRASTSFSLNGAEATIRGLVGWQHAFGDTAPASALSFDGGTSFLVAGAPIAKNATVLEAGFDLAMSGNATFGVSYQGQLAGRAQQHGFDASLSLKF